MDRSKPKRDRDDEKDDADISPNDQLVRDSDSDFTSYTPPADPPLRGLEMPSPIPGPPPIEPDSISGLQLLDRPLLGTGASTSLTIQTKTSQSSSGGGGGPPGAPTEISPDPEHWTNLYHNLTRTVGVENVLVPPPTLNNEESKLFLKSDSMALLYFYYKLPKYRKMVKEQVDRPLWCGWGSGQGHCGMGGGHLCGNIKGQFQIRQCLQVTGGCLILPCFAWYSTLDVSWFTGPHPRFDEPALFLGENPDQITTTTKSGITKSSALFRTSYLDPLTAAGFEPNDALLSCSEWSWCWCFLCAQQQYRHAVDLYIQKRYGNLPFGRTIKNRSAADRYYHKDPVPEALRQYWEDALERDGYPIKSKTVQEGSEWRGTQREFIGPNAAPIFAEFDPEQTERVVKLHNAKWGHIHQVDASLLKTHIIFYDKRTLADEPQCNFDENGEPLETFPS